MSGSVDEILRAALANALVAVQAHEQELGRLDAVAGDGDHGSTMVRGLAAAVAAADGPAMRTACDIGVGWVNNIAVVGCGVGVGVENQKRFRSSSSTPASCFFIRS